MRHLTRGDWAAANAQIRTYLESLFTSIAKHLRPQESEGKTFENIRQLLGEIDFFSKERNEWTPKGDGYINGLFKMLHTEGSHPGVSDEERSTFRLHLVLVTSRTFLRRVVLGKQACRTEWRKNKGPRFRGPAASYVLGGRLR